MKIKKISNLIAEIDGSEVTLVPVTLKKIYIPSPSTDSGISAIGTYHEALVVSKDESDKIEGYLFTPPVEVAK